MGQRQVHAPSSAPVPRGLPGQPLPGLLALRHRAAALSFRRGQGEEEEEEGEEGKKEEEEEKEEKEGVTLSVKRGLVSHLLLLSMCCFSVCLYVCRLVQFFSGAFIA